MKGQVCIMKRERGRIDLLNFQQWPTTIAAPQLSHSDFQSFCMSLQTTNHLHQYVFPCFWVLQGKEKRREKWDLYIFCLEKKWKIHCEEPLAIFTFGERKKPEGTPNPSVIFDPFSFLVPLDGHLQTALCYKFLNSTVCLQ